ncbi:hypothetical protein ACH5RR_017961 [Cinchona calisaya]|uniref:Protein E6-like n=1 Tax=Cinchona calisaya TaxID=153742 RepID=A0ABD2ZNS4_9GENT
MAPIAKTFFLLFLLTLLSSLQIIQARDPQNFNKIPSNNGAKETEVIPDKQEQEPNFIPENENGGYGLYGKENVEPYKTTPTNLPYNSQLPKESYPTKYLPKNYNTKAYVTEPEGYRSENNYNNNNFYNGEDTYYNNNEQQGSFGETKLLGSSYTNPSNNRNNYYNNNKNKYYNGEQQASTRFNNYNKKNNYYNTGGNTNTNGGVQKQGMSDTRFMENGKYFYDINMEQNFNRGSYGANDRGYYGNNNNNYNENSFKYSNNNYQDQEQFQNFQDEENLP